MTFPISPGVYAREDDRSFIVPAVANSIGGIVISANRGPASKIALITNNKQFVETYGKPSPSNPSMYSALAFLERGNRLLVVRAINGASASYVNIVDAQLTPAVVYVVTASSPGTWGNNLKVSFSAPEADGMFNVTVKDGATTVETFRVTRDSTKLDGYGKSLYIEDVINNRSAFITVEDQVANTNPHVATTDAVLSGGTNDIAAPTSGQINTAYQLFENKEDVEVNLLINGGWSAVAVQTELNRIAETRGDCVALLDMPFEENTVNAMVGYVNDADNDGTGININSSYSAIYAPWVQIYDNYTDKTVFVPPSGYVAGVYAYTASVSEVWYAPAGVRRGLLRVLGVQLVFTEGERDSLYTNNVNPIQSFSGEGIQVYGQKTLQRQASALDRVNVRMLMITIEKAIARALRPFVFEFNDQFTRENISSIITNYLEDIRARRGVYDFLVTCDETNNTSVVIDQNKLIVDVYVKPTRVAEFIQLNAIITSTGASFTSD